MTTTLSISLEDRWQAIPLSERDKIYKLFLDMNMGEIFGLYKVRESNHSKFRTIADYCIKWREFIKADGTGFVLIWNEDRDKIRKEAC